MKRLAILFLSMFLINNAMEENFDPIKFDNQLNTISNQLNLIINNINLDQQNDNQPLITEIFSQTVLTLQSISSTLNNQNKQDKKLYEKLENIEVSIEELYEKIKNVNLYEKIKNIKFQNNQIIGYLSMILTTKNEEISKNKKKKKKKKKKKQRKNFRRSQSLRDLGEKYVPNQNKKKACIPRNVTTTPMPNGLNKITFHNSRQTIVSNSDDTSDS